MNNAWSGSEAIESRCRLFQVEDGSVSVSGLIHVFEFGIGI